MAYDDFTFLDGDAFGGSLAPGGDEFFGLDFIEDDDAAFGAASFLYPRKPHNLTDAEWRALSKEEQDLAAAEWAALSSEDQDELAPPSGGGGNSTDALAFIRGLLETGIGAVTELAPVIAELTNSSDPELRALGESLAAGGDGGGQLTPAQIQTLKDAEAALNAKPWYKHPIFIATAASVGVITAVAVTLRVVGGGGRKAPRGLLAPRRGYDTSYAKYWGEGYANQGDDDGYTYY